MSSPLGERRDAQERSDQPANPHPEELMRDGDEPIAGQLFLTEATVKWHVKQILTKTASSDRAEAVAGVLGGAR